MRFSIWPLVALPLLLGGCGIQEIFCSASPLANIAASEVSAIHVKRWKTADQHELWVRVDDRQRIDQILAQVQALNGGFRHEPAWRGELPPPEYAFTWKVPGSQSVVWVGPGWLGILDTPRTQGTQGARYRDISESQHSRLVALLSSSLGGGNS